jgi:TonB family protein
MRSALTLFLAVSLGASVARAQLPAVQAAPDLLPITYAGPGVTTPELIAGTLPLANRPDCEKRTGRVSLSAVIDPSGVPHDIFFVNPSGDILERMAVKIAAQDRFKPGNLNGNPAAVAISLEISMKACLMSINLGHGNQGTDVQLLEQPDQQVSLLRRTSHAPRAVFTGPAPANDAPVEIGPGSRQSPPLLIHSQEAEFSAEALRAHVSGVCLLSLFVDQYGLPQQIKVERALGSGLDENAVAAVNHYRFLPAMKDNRPVATHIRIEVEFRSK